MGEIRVRVRLVTAVDEALAQSGHLQPADVRFYETEALVDTGAVTSALPLRIVQHLGLRARGRRIAQYADGRQEAVDLTGPVIFQILGRDTLGEALVLGDEALIGQTVLETLDLLADCTNRQVIPNPAHPDQPVLRV